MKNILKQFIIILTITGVFSSSVASYANEGGEDEKPLELNTFGSAAEIYKALSPELSLEEYLAREQQVKGMLVKRKAGEDARKSYQGLRSALQILAYVRERFRAMESRRAEFFNQPVRSATPGKSINKDGSVTYSGTNTRFLEYFADKFIQNKDDLEEVRKRIKETPGNHAHKGFSLTLNMTSEDKLGNITRRPLYVSLRNENTHFPDWMFSRQLTPTYAQMDANDPSTEYVYYAPSTIYVKYLECTGDWWALNNKESNAFGYVLKTYQESTDQWGVKQYITENILNMDLAIREPTSYHRLVTIDEGESSYSYEEDTTVLDFYITHDEEGALQYLPSIVETIHYNDEQAPDRVTTAYKFYKYDDNDRVVNSLTAVYVKDSSDSYFTIGIVNVDEFDPLTGLAPISQTSPNITSSFSGNAEMVKQYGEIMWRAWQDEDINNIMQQASDMQDVVRVCWDIASQVVQDGLNYEAAKINTLVQHSQKIADFKEEKDTLLAAQSLNMDGSKKEIKELAKMLSELRKEYGKIAIPHL